ncbi:MAG TPA: hypothetical protein VFJ43_12365 [Bacteroidia bacterium]|nr:hypothetical protein [Bacteroidia bacterium]
MLINTDIYEYLIYAIVLVFIVLSGISIRKKKIRRSGILMIITVVLIAFSVWLPTISGTLYLIHENYSCTTYHVFGKASMKFESEITMKSKSLEYVIDPDPGKIMVLNKSMMDLYLEEEPFNPQFEKVTIPAWTTKKIDIPGIDILPDNTTTDNTLFGGTKSIRYHLSKY